VKAGPKTGQRQGDFTDNSNSHTFSDHQISNSDVKEKQRLSALFLVLCRMAVHNIIFFT
jgi:hypothetical protein